MTERDNAPLESDVAAMAFVEACSLCQGLPHDLLEQLFRGGTVHIFGPGAVVFSEGESDDFLYLIFSGSVTVRKRSGATELELASLERPAVFGEFAALTGQRRTASIVTRTETRLVCFPGALVRTVAEGWPKLGRKLAALMAGRQRDTEKKLPA